jgi:SRSO17 transposase
VPRSADPGFWDERLGRFFDPFSDLLEVGVRAEDARRNARAYLTGLLLPGERKSMEPMARRLPGRSADQFQNFITDSPWNPDLVQRRLIEQMAPRIGSSRGVLSLDDTSFAKQGRASVGVGHQWCGSLGKNANCQVGVSLYYVLPNATFNPDLLGYSLGIRLYLPKDWTDDPRRRTAARIPPYVEFTEKWKIGLALIDRARDLQVPHRAVLADADYGTRSGFRAALRERREPYALGVQVGGMLRVMPLGPDGRPAREKPLSLREVLRSLPGSAWRTIQWAKGSQGPLTMELARLRVEVYHKNERRHDGPLVPSGEKVWLIFERRPNETKAYFVWGFDQESLRAHAELFRARWPIEQYFQQMKEELGLDHFEGRTWTGWHHHVTMVALAHAFLMGTRIESVPPGQHRPTVPKVRRWFNGRVGLALAQAATAAGTDDALRNRVLNRVFALSDLPVYWRRGRWSMPTLMQYARGEA